MFVRKGGGGSLSVEKEGAAGFGHGVVGVTAAEAVTGARCIFRQRLSDQLGFTWELKTGSTEGGWLKRAENDAKNLLDRQIRLRFENHPLHSSREITF